MTTISPNVQLSVKRIKEFSFFMNEMLFAQKQPKGDILRIDLSLQLAFTIENNLIFLLVRVYYHFPDSSEDEKLVDTQVQNVFEIPDLKKFLIGPSEIILPSEVITTAVSLSLSHTRALIAKNIAGTLLQDNLMAITDPVVIAKHFFPKMFEQNTPQK